MSVFRICSGCNRKLIVSANNFYRYRDKYYTRCVECVRKYMNIYYANRNIIKKKYKICKKCSKTYLNTSKNFFKHCRRGDGLYETCKKCEIKRRKLNYNNTQFKIKHKICCVCKQNKKIINFDINRATKDGYNYKCKKCYRKYANTKANHIRDRYRCRFRERTDPRYKLYRRIRARIYMALKNNYKETSTKELLGCSIEFLKQYLEQKFKPGMSWNNYGLNGWHIDHIIPCDSFSLINLKQQKKCFNYTNLQPLWAKENISKGNKYECNTI